MNSPILLFLNGPVGIGKSTIAKKYADDHKLALVIDADHFVGSMGQWLENESEARVLALHYVGLVATAHLQAGYDVVVPFHLSRPEDMDTFEQAAKGAGARLVECALVAPKEEVFARALARGTWGEPNSPPLTHDDLPILEELFAKFQSALAARPQAVRIAVETSDIEGTYKKVLEQVTRSTSTPSPDAR